MSRPAIIVNHAGFSTADTKRAVFPATDVRVFELQDMLQNAEETSLGAFENWRAVFRGELEPAPGEMGGWLTGDFSAWRQPGIYRLALPEGRGHSVIFGIHDGVLSELPRLFFGYTRANRCGAFEDGRRGPCHLDDGILSTTGKPIDATGGWHDAGDTRKWMAHCAMPALAFSRWLGRGGADPWEKELPAEIAWGVRFILKMQDPATGMIYEDVGGGGDQRRREGMTWWHENVSGCYADNAENRFTDNLPGSGDERSVRDRYNPVAQYTNIAILMAAVAALEETDASLAAEARNAAANCWRFMDGRTGDDYHGWTSIRAWRLQAALAVKAGSAAIEAALDALLELRAPATGFWFMDDRKIDSHRGVLQSAQPLIALAALIEALPAHPRRGEIEDTVRRCLHDYVLPLCGTNPFGFMPYGVYFHPTTEGDRYRAWRDGLRYRFFMPNHGAQQVNVGLAAHWMSWAHALAGVSSVFGLPGSRAAALDQIHWLLGHNPAQASFVSGFGYNNPMPHSRALGYLIGGFMNGPRGDADDEMFVDTGGHGDWSTCEYWNPIGASALLALCHLLPGKIPSSAKLGRTPPG